MSEHRGGRAALPAVGHFAAPATDRGRAGRAPLRRHDAARPVLRARPADHRARVPVAHRDASPRTAIPREHLVRVERSRRLRPRRRGHGPRDRRPRSGSRSSTSSSSRRSASGASAARRSRRSCRRSRRRSTSARCSTSSPPPSAGSCRTTGWRSGSSPPTARRAHPRVHRRADAGHAADDPGRRGRAGQRGLELLPRPRHPARAGLLHGEVRAHEAGRDPFPPARARFGSRATSSAA